MIKQISSIELNDYIKKNPKSILLDVRTNEEWNADGKPDGKPIGLQTYFLTIQFADGHINENFLDEFKKLDIKEGSEILTMCMGGIRSQVAAELLTKANYSCSNISDGFLGNSENKGWKKSGLPCV